MIKHTCLAALWVFYVNLLYGQMLQTNWTQNVGGYFNDFAAELCVDYDGNLWGIGYVDGAVDNLAHHGQDDVFLFKMDAQGNLLWQTVFGSTYKDRGHSLAIDAHNNCWISGYFNDTIVIESDTLISSGYTDAFLIKFSPSGQLLWHTTLGSSGFEQGQQLAIRDHAVYWTGFFQGNHSIGGNSLIEATNIDLFLIKLDTSGNFIWSKQWGCPTVESILGINIHSNGNIAVLSNFRDAVLIEGDTIWGYTTSNTLLTHFNPTGHLLWTYSIGGTGAHVIYDDIGNLYLAGSYQYSIEINGQTIAPQEEFDAYLLALDHQGNYLWSNLLQGTDLIIATDLLWHSNRQELYVCGIYQGTIYYGNDSLARSSDGPRHIDDDIFLMVFDGQGTLLHSQRFGNNDSDWAAALTLDTATEALYLLGSYNSGTTIGNDTIYAMGGSDLFVAQFHINPVSIHNIETTPIAVKIAPNPTTQYLNIHLSSEQITAIQISIVNQQGQVVQFMNVDAPNPEIQLELLPSLPQGMYWLCLKDSNNIQSVPFTLLK